SRERRSRRTVLAPRTRALCVARRPLLSRAVRRRARPFAFLVLVSLGVRAFPPRRSADLEVPARRALRTRRAGRPLRPLRTRITRHALPHLRSRRTLRPHLPLTALRPLRSTHALPARRTGRTLRTPRPRGPHSTPDARLHA